jgi:hypothetical protein
MRVVLQQNPPAEKRASFCLGCCPVICFVYILDGVVLNADCTEKVGSHVFLVLF